MNKINPYSNRFINAELKKVREGEVFIALADHDYAKEIFMKGHYINRQALLANQLKKPILIAYDRSLPLALIERVRSAFWKIEREIYFNPEDATERNRIMEAVELLLQKLHPEEESPEANPTDAFNDPMHGLERIG